MTTALERRMEIANLVGVRGKVHVDELADYFNVTGATIRADLRFLDDNGYIVRSHGYALVNRYVLSRLAMSATSKMQSKISNFGELIASTVYCTIEERSTIFIDSSSVLRQSLRHLNDFKAATIVTRDLNLVQSLPQIRDSKFFVTGGRVNTDSMKMTGSHMLSSLKRYRFNTVIVHVDSFNTKLGVFTQSEFDADMIRLLCELSEKMIIIAESDAFNHNDAFWACDPNCIDMLITDHELDNETRESLALNNMKIVQLT